MMIQLPQEGFLRIWQILGDKKNTPALIPISRSSWWAGVRSGRFPKPTKMLGKRITAWRIADIKDLIERAEEGQKKIR